MTTPGTCHLMMDIESLGVRVGSVVLSVALVRFEDHASVSLNLNIHEQVALGLEINPDTHKWWADKLDAWGRATANPYALNVGLPHISAWIAWAANGRPVRLWCHGAGFDAPLLQDVYRAAGQPVPWGFRDVRDTRTLYDLAGIDIRDFSSGLAHCAEDDALCQTRAAQEALKRLAAPVQIAPEPKLRFFHHPESDSWFYTNDGSNPHDGLVNEIGPLEYVRGAGYEGQVRLAGAA